MSVGYEYNEQNCIHNWSWTDEFEVAIGLQKPINQLINREQEYFDTMHKAMNEEAKKSLDQYFFDSIIKIYNEHRKSREEWEKTNEAKN